MESHLRMSKRTCFHMFRYQILPTSQSIQTTFSPYHISSYAELIKKKNEIFSDVLRKITKLQYSRTELIHKSEVQDSYFHIQIAANRNIKRSTKEFKEEELENWPFSRVILNNDPNSQQAMIELNRKVFADTFTIASILQDNINAQLKHYQLHVVFEKQFEKKYFWDLIAANVNKITQVDFELVSPNLANISKNLAFDLRALSHNTNTQKTHLQLNSDKTSALTLGQDDKLISSLVNYSADGGGNISLKVRGYKKKIHTSKGSVEKSFDELEIKGKSLSQLLEIIKGML